MGSGTILNIEEGVTKCVQQGLRHVGIEEPDLKKLRVFIGPPLKEQFMARYGLSERQANEALEKHRERYLQYGAQETKLYPGAVEALKNFRENGWLQALASSKICDSPEAITAYMERVFEV